jgi:hypothetical protein
MTKLTSNTDESINFGNEYNKYNDGIEFMDENTNESNQATEIQLLKTTKQPSFAEMMEKNKQNGMKNQNNNNKSEWINPALREIERERTFTFEEKSRSYLPLNLPLFESVVYTDSKTTIIIPVTITIEKPKEGKQNLKQSRLVVAMMKLLQSTFQDTYIGTVTNNSKYSKIAHHRQVPLDNKTLQHYMSDLVMGLNNTWSTKILIHENHDLKEFLMSSKVRNYLANKQISIAKNHLSTAMPYNVGFLEKAVQSRETTGIQKARLMKYLPEKTPDFQINIYKANSSDRKSTYLVMIQADKDNVMVLTKILQKASKENDLGFFHGENICV